jgi:hypothetical protein
MAIYNMRILCNINVFIELIDKKWNFLQGNDLMKEKVTRLEKLQIEIVFFNNDLMGFEEFYLDCLVSYSMS